MNDLGGKNESEGQQMIKYIISGKILNTFNQCWLVAVAFSQPYWPSVTYLLLKSNFC